MIIRRPGSRNVPLGRLPELLDQLPREKPVGRAVRPVSGRAA